MALTLLQLVARTSGTLGLTQPTSVIGSSVNQTMQLLALARQLGGDLVREFEWQRLVKTVHFTTTAAITKTGNTTEGSIIVDGIGDTSDISGVDHDVISGSGIPVHTEVYSIDSGTQITLTLPATATATGVTLTFKKQDYINPDGLDRYISDVLWDQTAYQRIRGSRSSQDWQALQSSAVSSEVNYRIANGRIRIYPPPTAALNLVFEYVSSLWVAASAGAEGTKESFTLDGDHCVFHDDLMLAGLKYYFLKAKKLDFGIEKQEYDRILSTRKAQDVPESKKSLAPRAFDPLIGIPEGSWTF